MRGSSVVVFLKEIIKRYFKDDVGDSAAAMTYYLIFSFFPLIVMGSTLLGYADISPDAVYKALNGLLPKDIINLINQYILYVTINKSKNILLVSIFFTVYFPFRAMVKIVGEINRAYQVIDERSVAKKLAITFIFMLFFVFVVVVSLVLLLLGRTILLYVSQYINIPAEFIDFWLKARFWVMAAISFIVITMLYWIAPGCRVRLREALPGAAFAVGMWILASAVFSYYVENLGNYSVLFGSIGAIIVLLIWIYMTVTILIMGAEINSVLKTIKGKNKKINI